MGAQCVRLSVVGKAGLRSSACEAAGQCVEVIRESAGKEANQPISEGPLAVVVSGLCALAD